MSDKTKGLFGKFYVRRVDGRDQPGGDKEGADYFVLDLAHDPFAVPALVAYEAACRKEYPALARDLRRKLIQRDVGHAMNTVEHRLRAESVQEALKQIAEMIEAGRATKAVEKLYDAVTGGRDVRKDPPELVPDVIEQEHAECFVAKEGAPLSTADDCETDGWYGCDYCARKKPQEIPTNDCDACYAGKPVRCEKPHCPRVS